MYQRLTVNIYIPYKLTLALFGTMSLANRCACVRNVQSKDVESLREECVSLGLENLEKTLQHDDQVYLLFSSESSAVTAVRSLRQVKLGDSEEALNVTLLPLAQESVLTNLLEEDSVKTGSASSSSEDSKKSETVKQIVDLLKSLLEEDRKEISTFLQDTPSSSSLCPDMKSAGTTVFPL